MDKVFDGKRVLITGGTGSLGKVLAKRILSGKHGAPERVIIFSRDEAKQNDMRMEFRQRPVATDELIFQDFERSLEFVIGDVRDFHSVAAVCSRSDIVFNAAALKQVPSCEYFPHEAVRTNIDGPHNIVRAIRELNLGVETVVGVSTDKACRPVNVMGMTKALQERIFIAANIQSKTRFVCARYGNVLASRGSVIPLFHSQIRAGGPVTITTKDMTRFLLNLDDAVDTIVAAVAYARPGEIYVPKVPAALVEDLARVLIGDRSIQTTVIGIRPGEKVHEALISEDEAVRAVDRGDYFAIQPMLPEIGEMEGTAGLVGEFSSDRFVVDLDGARQLLVANKLMVEDVADEIETGEMLR